MQQVRDGEQPACGADHVPRAHAGGMPRGGREFNHAAHVGARTKQREDAEVSSGRGGGVRASVLGLRAGEREQRDAARDCAGHGLADRGQPALDAGAARPDRDLPRLHPRVQS